MEAHAFKWFLSDFSMGLQFWGSFWRGGAGLKPEFDILEHVCAKLLIHAQLGNFLFIIVHAAPCKKEQFRKDLIQSFRKAAFLKMNTPTVSCEDVRSILLQLSISLSFGQIFSKFGFCQLTSEYFIIWKNAFIY